MSLLLITVTALCLYFILPVIFYCFNFVIYFIQVRRRRPNGFLKKPKSIIEFLILGDIGEIIIPAFTGDKRPFYQITRDFYEKVFDQYRRIRSGIIWLSWIPLFVTVEPEIIELILRGTDYIDKGAEYDVLKPWLKTGLLTSNGDKWRSRRKLLTASFHFKILRQFIDAMNEHSLELVDKWSSFGDGEKIDVYKYLPLSALDTICDTSMGVKINALDNPESDYVRSVNEATELMFARIVNPLKRIDWIFYRLNEGQRLRKSIKILQKFTRDVIENRLAAIKSSEQCEINTVDNNENITAKRINAQPFIDLLIDYHLKSFNNGKYEFTLDDIQEEVDTFMFEGHDTTGSCLSWALLLLAANVDKQEKCQQELDKTFGDDRRRFVEEDDLKQLKYLECVLKETLRIFPTVPFITRVLNKETIIDDVTIPKYGSFLLPIFYLNRLEDHFPDPMVFKPERFEGDVKYDIFAYIPFSAGQRNCIGQKFAMMEMKIYLANILRNFRIETELDPIKVPLSLEFVTKPKTSLDIKMYKR